jgi:hypothetical protein
MVKHNIKKRTKRTKRKINMKGGLSEEDVVGFYKDWRDGSGIRQTGLGKLLKRARRLHIPDSVVKALPENAQGQQTLKNMVERKEIHDRAATGLHGPRDERAANMRQLLEQGPQMPNWQAVQDGTRQKHSREMRNLRLRDATDPHRYQRELEETERGERQTRIDALTGVQADLNTRVEGLNEELGGHADTMEEWNVQKNLISRRIALKQADIDRLDQERHEAVSAHARAIERELAVENTRPRRGAPTPVWQNHHRNAVEDKAEAEARVGEIEAELNQVKEQHTELMKERARVSISKGMVRRKEKKLESTRGVRKNELIANAKLLAPEVEGQQESFARLADAEARDKEELSREKAGRKILEERRPIGLRSWNRKKKFKDVSEESAGEKCDKRSQIMYDTNENTYGEYLNWSDRGEDLREKFRKYQEGLTEVCLNYDREDRDFQSINLTTEAHNVEELKLHEELERLHNKTMYAYQITPMVPIDQGGTVDSLQTDYENFENLVNENKNKALNAIHESAVSDDFKEKYRDETEMPAPGAPATAPRPTTESQWMGFYFYTNLLNIRRDRTNTLIREGTAHADAHTEEEARRARFDTEMAALNRTQVQGQSDLVGAQRNARLQASTAYGDRSRGAQLVRGGGNTVRRRKRTKQRGGKITRKKSRKPRKTSRKPRKTSRKLR